jgi:streptogramin lyase
MYLFGKTLRRASSSRGINCLLIAAIIALGWPASAAAQVSGDKIGRVTTGGAFTQYSIPTIFAQPDGIVAGPDGNLWFTERRGNNIGRITPAGVITEFPVPTANSEPTRITAGPDGNLWFSEGARPGNGQLDHIGRITTAGVITEFALAANAKSYGITAGPDGNLWFSEVIDNNGPGYLAAIGRITTTGTITVFPFDPNTIVTPMAIATGSDGALWFTELDNFAIGRVNTAGSVTNQYPLSTNSGPQGISAGPDGALWFTNGLDGCPGGCVNDVSSSTGNSIGRITTAGAITQFTIPTANSNPEEITTGPDGALWFAESRGNKIGRITTAGAFTEFVIPILQAYPFGITLGPDGALWFTEGPSLNDFTAAPTAGRAPLAVTFHASGLTLPMTYTLDFGDGTTGALTRSRCSGGAPVGHEGGIRCTASASHTYTGAGAETATLSNAAGRTLAEVTISLGGGTAVRPGLGSTAIPPQASPPVATSTPLPERRSLDQ